MKCIRSITVGLFLTFTLLFTTAFSGLTVNEQSHKLSTERIYQDIAWMASKDDARVAGTEGEWHAAKVIADRFRKLGLKVEIQRVPLTRFVSHGAELKINQPEIRSLNTAPLSYSPSTPNQGITANLVFANLGTESDFATVDVKGKIALIQRGSLTFYDKTQNAAKAGAIGVIIYNNASGIVNGTLGQETAIPALGISDTDGANLVHLLNSSQQVNITMKADTEIIQTYSQNIIGTYQAAKKSDPAKTLILGAHYDGVDTAAANDNASGTATMLEVARLLSKKKLDMNLRFIAFGAEENGLIGSRYYTQSLKPEEIDNIVGMVNMDMVGVGDTINVLTASPNAQSFVADLAVEKAKELNISPSRGWSTRSDHAPFEAVGIPVAFLHVSEDPYYHTDHDTLDKIQKENLRHVGTLVANLMVDIADIPKKVVPTKPEQLKELHLKEHNEWMME